MADKKFSAERRTPEQVEHELEQTRSEISRTIEAIQGRVSPGQLANDAYGYLSASGGGDFARNLGTAAKNNPVPVALVGLGLAWLMMGRGTPTYLQQPAGQDDVAGGTDSGTSFSAALDTVGSQTRRARGSAASAIHAVSDAVARAGSSLLGFGRTVGDGAAGTSERVRRLSEDARNLATEWNENAGEVAASTRDQIHRAGEAVQEQTMQMRDRTSQMLQDQPLIAGALGLAIGAVLGALLPLSRRENEVMGETRDQLVDQAVQYGQQAVDQATDAAKKVAGAAAEAAKDEAEKHGLSGGSEGNGAQGDDSQSSASSENSPGGSPSPTRFAGGSNLSSGPYSSGPKST